MHIILANITEPITGIINEPSALHQCTQLLYLSVLKLLTSECEEKNTIFKCYLIESQGAYKCFDIEIPVD